MNERKRRMKPNPAEDGGYHSREHDETPWCRKTHEIDTECEPVEEESDND